MLGIFKLLINKLFLKTNCIINQEKSKIISKVFTLPHAVIYFTLIKLNI